MNALGWMCRGFRQTNDEQSRNVPTTQSQLGEQKCYPDPGHRQPRVRSESSTANKVEEVRGERTVDMSPELFHGFLAIGTLSAESVTAESMTPKFATSPKEETDATENELWRLSKKLEKLVGNEVKGASSSVTLREKEIKGIDTIVNDNFMVYPFGEYSFRSLIEMPSIREEAKEQKTSGDGLFEKTVTSYKGSGKFDTRKKRETNAFDRMKKMLKKLDFPSQCIQISAIGNAIVTDSIERKHTKALPSSRKIHPEKAGLHEAKNVTYDETYVNDATIKDEYDMSPHNGILKQEMASCRKFPDRALNSQLTKNKAYWIKTDADFFVLEF